jgi:hypothetical protein
MGHGDIVIFNRQFVTELQVKSDSHPEGFSVEMWQGGVVVGFPASQPGAAKGESYSRAEAEVDFLWADRGVNFRHRLGYVECPIPQFAWVLDHMKGKTGA